MHDEACAGVGEGGQLRLSHLTPATPSTGRGLGSDLAILGATSRREWCVERPQSPAVGSRGGSHGVWEEDCLTVHYDAVSASCSTFIGPTTSSLRGAAMSALMGEHSPAHCIFLGLVVPSKPPVFHHAATAARC